MSQEVSSVYLTTPLYYVNARPHLGHAYATFLADSQARYYRQKKVRTYFLTGTDEHGEKIAAKAKSENRTPQEFSDEISGDFKKTWAQLKLSPDVFYRTTLPSHYSMVQRALVRLKEKGDIYFGEYEGKYCMGCERFRTDQEWNQEGLCPDHLTPPDIRKESNYFFRMSAYQKRLIDFYKSHPQAIVPSQYMKETLAFLEGQPLEDFSISRPISRLTWGIPLPFDQNFVTYVWFDALLSYPGGIGYDGESFETSSIDKNLWSSVRHLIGKDILKTHAIYWPTMLMALEMPIFKTLQVSGFWLTSGLKMSKSLGNVVNPLQVCEKMGTDPFRYFLLREMSYGSDANFTWEGLVGRANAELANGVGNLTSRVLTLVHKNLDGKIPARDGRGEAERNLLTKMSGLPGEFDEHFQNARFHQALARFSEAIADCDKYINDQKPWSLAKDPSQKDRLGAVLGTAMDALWMISIVGYSALPEGMLQLQKALGVGSSNHENPPLWSQLNQLPIEGSSLGEIPRLYPRFENMI